MIDFINRQAAIDALYHVDEYNGRSIKAIRELPSAQQWIPCSKRLPEVGQWVLCQCRANIMDVLRLTDEDCWYRVPDTTYMGSFVIAWMPLPKPYLVD